MENEEFFQRVFEVGRRFKIMNPDKMRNTYGKMMHLLMDAVNTSNTKVTVLTPIKTVSGLLKGKGCLADVERYWREFILASSVIAVAGSQLEKQKSDAFAKLRDELVSKGKLTEDELELCVSSMNDHSSYVEANCYPVEQMLHNLHKYFRPEQDSAERSLEIRSGQGGSYLSHSHSTQFKFVRQSLMLWNEIQRKMCELWILTDADLLDPTNKYRLANTGQGMNRMREAPRIGVAFYLAKRPVFFEPQLGLV